MADHPYWVVAPSLDMELYNEMDLGVNMLLLLRLRFLLFIYAIGGITCETLVLGSICHLDPSIHHLVNQTPNVIKTHYFKPL